MEFAYADPPYIGQAFKHYRDDPRCAEVDHAALIASMCEDYPDGWALSGGANIASLQIIVPLLPVGARVMPWVKDWASFKPNVNPAYAWEPVFIWRGRKRTRKQKTIRDWVMAQATTRKGLAGAKPLPFSFAVFDWLNIQPDDELVDLYPGTGAVSGALHLYTQRLLWTA